MKVYIYKDSDENQWNYFVGRDTPSIKELRATITEIREFDMDAELYVQMMMGELPVDEKHSHDALLAPFFETAQIFWQKQSGGE